jgi:hypothetical protein
LDQPFVLFVPFGGYSSFVPFCGISSLPKIVRLLVIKPPHQKISIKKDRNFLLLTPIPLGTTVVLGTTDTSRSARLTRERKPVARATRTPKYLLRSKKLA